MHKIPTSNALMNRVLSALEARDPSRSKQIHTLGRILRLLQRQSLGLPPEAAGGVDYYTFERELAAQFSDLPPSLVSATTITFEAVAIARVYLDHDSDPDALADSLQRLSTALDLALHGPITLSGIPEGLLTKSNDVLALAKSAESTRSTVAIHLVDLLVHVRLATRPDAFQPPVYDHQKHQF